VQQIDSPHKKVGNTYNHQVGVIDDVAEIPGQDKDTASDDQAEYFYQAVEKDVVVKACQIEAQQEKGPMQEGWSNVGNLRRLPHFFLRSGKDGLKTVRSLRSKEDGNPDFLFLPD
jgi:hypothetical protein